MNQPCFEKNLPLNGIGWWFISSQSMFSILTSPATFFQRLPQGKQAIQVQLHSEKIQSVLGERLNISLALCSEFLVREILIIEEVSILQKHLLHGYYL